MQNSKPVLGDSSRTATFSSAMIASRDEMNLAEFPLAVLSTRTNPNIKTLEFADTQHMKSGELVERKWIITGADKFGLPTATDDDVVLGLICLSMRDGFREPKVYFTRYELLKILRWSTEGRSYARLTKSLDRLSGVRIRATNAFYDNALKSFQTRNFGIIDAYEINDERSKRGEVESYFIWSEALFESFKSGFIKKLDLDLYFSLNSSVSRRLYRYLDKHFYYRGTIEKPLLNFAFEKLGLSRTYKYVSSIRQQLDPAIEELVRVGFLAGVEYGGRGEGATVRFLAGRNQQAQAQKPVNTLEASRITSAPAASRPLPAPTLLEQLSNELMRRGLRREQVQRILAPHSSADLERVKVIIRYFDELQQKGDWRISRNPIGFLYRAVEKPKEFSLPTQYEKPQNSAQRPERKVFKASPLNDERADYQRFVDAAVSDVQLRLTDQQLQALFAVVDTKLACLKGILADSRYQEAREGCVREELAKLARVPDFAAWKRAQ